MLFMNTPINFKIQVRDLAARRRLSKGFGRAGLARWP
jgi:hypothetical protein